VKPQNASEALRGLSATAELLITAMSVVNMPLN